MQYEKILHTFIQCKYIGTISKYIIIGNVACFKIYMICHELTVEICHELIVEIYHELTRFIKGVLWRA